MVLEDLIWHALYTLDYGISVPAGINMPGGTLSKTNKRASWKITLWCWKIAFFVANHTFLNEKIVTSQKMINLLYEIRSMPAGKVPKNQ